MTEEQKRIRGGGPRVTAVMSVLGALLLAAGAYLLWTVRPGRTYVRVGSHELSKSELDRFAESRMRNAENRGIITHEQAQNPETLEKYRREAAQMWIFRTVLLDEAIRLKMKATPKDEEKYRTELDAALRKSGLYGSVDEYLKAGALPEDEMRRRFREDVLAHMLLKEKVEPNVAAPTLAEIEAERKRRQASGLPHGIPETRDAIREARYRRALGAYYRGLLRETQVHPEELVPTDAPRGSMPGL